jgi:hypothetical protein
MMVSPLAHSIEQSIVITRLFIMTVVVYAKFAHTSYRYSSRSAPIGHLELYRKLYRLLQQIPISSPIFRCFARHYHIQHYRKLYRKFYRKHAFKHSFNFTINSSIIL